MTNVILTAQNLTFVVPPHQSIFQSVSFSFQAGDVVCVLGNNGSGKSSFLKVCAGLCVPTYGHVAFNQTDIHGLSLPERSKKIAWLPQTLEKMENLSGIDFLNLSANMESLKKTDWEDEIERFDLANILKKDLTQLSGGEWKRLQLAKVWSRKAPVLFLDEPEGSLDLRHKMILAQQCKNYAKKNDAIVFIVTHEMGFAKQVAEHILAFHNHLLVWNSAAADFWQSSASLKLFGVLA